MALMLRLSHGVDWMMLMLRWSHGVDYMVLMLQTDMEHLLHYQKKEKVEQSQNEKEAEAEEDDDEEEHMKKSTSAGSFFAGKKSWHHRCVDSRSMVWPDDEVVFVLQPGAVLHQ